MLILPSNALEAFVSNFFDNKNWRKDWNIAQMPQDASSRVYYKLSATNSLSYNFMQSPRSFLVMYDNNTAGDNVASFVHVGEYLRNIGLSVPQIHVYDSQIGAAIIEDLGNMTINKFLSQCHDQKAEIQVYHSALGALLHMQTASVEKPLQLSKYTDELRLISMRNFFCDGYWRYKTGERMLQDLQDEFLYLWGRVLSAVSSFGPDVMLHRDYHVDNLFYLPDMMEHKKIGIIDFQDAMYGNRVADVAMLLDDARRFVSDAVRQSAQDYYIGVSGIDKHDFLEAYNILSAQCNMRILGIFATKAINGDNRYIQYMSRVLSYLTTNLLCDSLSPIRNLLQKNIFFDRLWIV